MKVLLINPPTDLNFSMFVLDDYNKKARSHQVPIWALYLHAYLKDSHDVEILDMAAKNMSISDIKNNIDGFDLIGITCTIAQWLTVKALAHEIKSYSIVPIIVGGVNPSLYPWETLQCRDINYVIQGFGQKPLKELCDRLENNKNVSYIDRLFTKHNCDKETKGEFNFENVDDYPMPDRSVLDINDYVMPFAPENPCTSMVTSFGCPFKCKFCRCKEFGPMILRDTDKIIEEMKHIESIGIRSVLFNDELFTMNIRRIKEICTAIIDNNINLNWSVRSRANLVNKEALELIKEAGAFNIHLGIESGTDRILKEMGKGLTIDTIQKSVETIKSVGLGVTASFMLGYLDESHEEIFETIDFAKSLDLNVSQFFVVQPEPNTELYNDLKLIKNLPEDIYSNFTLDPESVDLKNNIASTFFERIQMDTFLKHAYSQTKNLYGIKSCK